MVAITLSLTGGIPTRKTAQGSGKREVSNLEQSVIQVHTDELAVWVHYALMSFIRRTPNLVFEAAMTSCAQLLYETQQY